MTAETTTTEDKVKFELGDTEYELPDVLDLDIDEWMVVYEYSGVVLDDFAPLEDADAEAVRQQKLRHPGFMKSLVHIGYQRAHPKQQKSTIKAMVGGAKMITLLESMAPEEEAPEEEDPTSASEPEPQSNGSSPSSIGSSSGPSPKSSDARGGLPESIGTSG